jgi:hypothetical protein
MEEHMFLELLDTALVYERAGFTKQAIEAWQELIDTINAVNEGKTIARGIAVKKLAKERIERLEQNVSN